MSTKRDRLNQLVICILTASVGFVLTACRDRTVSEPLPATDVGAAPVKPESTAPLTAEDEAAIYAATIEALFVRRGDSIGGVDAPVIYLDKRIQFSGSLESDGTPKPPRTIDETTQRLIQVALDDFPARIVWVDGRDEVPFAEELRPGDDNGAILNLSQIARRADGAALIEASLTFNCNCELGGGSLFVVQFQDGRWQVTGEETTWES